MNTIERLPFGRNIKDPQLAMGYARVIAGILLMISARPPDSSATSGNKKGQD